MTTTTDTETAAQAVVRAAAGLLATEHTPAVRNDYGACTHPGYAVGESTQGLARVHHQLPNLKLSDPNRLSSDARWAECRARVNEYAATLEAAGWSVERKTVTTGAILIASPPAPVEEPEDTLKSAARRARAARLQAHADQLEDAAKRQSERASAMYGRFAGGQPLLRGHHSYRSARRDKDRADAASDRAIDVYKEAEQAKTRARFAQADAAARTEIAEKIATRARPWQPSDFQRGDIVTVRTFETHQDSYRVKRVNKKSLTLDGGGGGMDDPRREYDRVLSRTRDGVTITNPDA
ncbi:DUF3560 domain-containing protein (plasmid) [Streptomyces graminifolii]|uniref:DUF3560 domain-containing protein n=1 Tax=Streptomyces graminifolii TaxID=1266771 RepID=UPI004057FB45